MNVACAAQNVDHRPAAVRAHCPGILGELATAREWPRVNGHFRSTKSPIARRSPVQCGSTQRFPRFRGQAGRGRPASSLSRSRSSAAAVNTATISGSNCLPLRRRTSATAAFRAVCAMVHLGDVGNLRHPHRRPVSGDPAAPTGRPLPSHRSYAIRQGFAHIRTQADLIGEQCGRQAMGLHQCAEIPACVQKDLGRQLSPFRQCRSATEIAEQKSPVRRAGPVDEVAVVPHRDVVAKPPRVLVRVGMTPNPHHQTRVENGPALTFAEPQPLGKPRAHCGRPQHVIHRLTEPKVDRQQIGPPVPRSATQLRRRASNSPLP